MNKETEDTIYLQAYEWREVFSVVSDRQLMGHTVQLCDQSSKTFPSQLPSVDKQLSRGWVLPFIHYASLFTCYVPRHAKCLYHTFWNPLRLSFHLPECSATFNNLIIPFSQTCVYVFSLTQSFWDARTLTSLPYSHPKHSHLHTYKHTHTYTYTYKYHYFHFTQEN